ncbi:MAG TPA: TIGR02996 domain-containing protein [Kofleriaceae bacterium]
MTDPLFAAIYADPDDDAPRHVLADALIDRGDPRGEFISLQLARGRNDLRIARELELQQAHATEWLGALAIVLDARRSRFERGFLSHAAVVPNTKKQLRKLAREPGWATVERFVHGVPPQLLDHASFAALRAIDVNGGEFRRLARRGDALSHVVELKLSMTVELDDLARVFPSVRRVHLRYAPEAAELATFAAIGVRELAIERMAFLELDGGDFVEALCAKRSPFERVVLGELELRRDDDGMLRQVVA